MRRALGFVFIAVAMFACSAKEKPLSVPGEKVYALKGKIVSRDANDNTVNIDHQAIPGFMEAMTMDYSVRGAKVAALPPNGSPIEAKLHVTNDAYWVTDVKVTR